ncbi:MAG: NADH-quinone oxidoreductase subunit NuoG [Candidatus Aureabacteria bacterium]|nr:NADH-quinone oxidoreductase subunit NuoG [Candidatus Auribacterota bacterium]
MATIYIDNKPYVVKDRQNLLQVCLSLGFDLPYFCWHPAMHSVGACRQCAVKLFRDEKDTRGKIIMACMTLAKDGIRISIDDPEAKKFRAGITEFLMTCHPHDCPVCDEGGECHLQDMTVMTGHTYRGYRFRKRTHRNQYLGPFLHHEMNRCIACYRCVRFYCDYAGGRDLNAFQCGNRVYFGRHEDGVLENIFSGNLAEVCPTGVFTDKTFRRHYTRKWDLQTAPSVCVHCALGCNTIPGERYGTLRRIHNRYNGEVNGYFLCDRGRYGYEFVNGNRRIRGPLLRGPGGGEARPCTRGEALSRMEEALHTPGRLIGIGSPRASLESNFALRTLVGKDRFFSGVSERERKLSAAALEILQRGPARTPSLHEIRRADAVFIIGEDVTNTAPIMALTLLQLVPCKKVALARSLQIEPWDDMSFREAIQQECAPLYIASAAPTGLDDEATRVYHATPDDVARLAFAVAHVLESGVPGMEGLPENVSGLAGEIACALKEAERPLVISGIGGGSLSMIEGAAAISRALRSVCGKGELSFLFPECNSMGLALMGGRSLAEAREVLREGDADTLVILENDLFIRDAKPAVEELLKSAQHIIVVDHTHNRTSERAELVLPASTFAEGSGTLVNSEGRAQRFYRVFVPDGDIRESWRWIQDMISISGRGEAAGWKVLDDIAGAMAREMPEFEAVTRIAPPADFRISGEKIPRQPHRASGRTAMHAHTDVHEPMPSDDLDSPLAFTMEGYGGQAPPALIPRFWSPGWNSVQAVNKFQQEIAGPLKGGDPGQRLIEPAEGVKSASPDKIPEAEGLRPGEWLLVPLYHTFGTEEMSVLSSSVAERVPAPYLALCPEDALSLGIGEGEAAELIASGEAQQRIRVRYLKGLPRGVAGLPVSLPGVGMIDLPQKVSLVIPAKTADTGKV